MEEDAIDVLERLPVTKIEDEEWRLFPLHTWKRPYIERLRV